MCCNIFVGGIELQIHTLFPECLLLKHFTLHCCSELHFDLFFSPVIRKLINKFNFEALDVKMEKCKVSLVLSHSYSQAPKLSDQYIPSKVEIPQLPHSQLYGKLS